MIKYYLLLLFLIVLRVSHFSAAEKLESLLIEIENTSTEAKKGRLLNLIADQYLDYDLDAAKKYAYLALENGEQNDNIKVMSDAYVNLGNYYNIKGDLDSNLYFYEKSYQLCLTGKNKNDIASALNRIGIVYEYKSNYNAATPYFLKAIEYYQQADNQKGIANVYNSLGIINERISNKEKALFYYQKALKIHQQTADKIGYASTLNNIGEMHAEAEAAKLAFDAFKKSASIFIEKGDFLSLATPYNNIGALYLKANQLDSAKFYHEKALALYLNLENKGGIANTYQQLSNVFVAENELDSAEFILKKAIPILKEVGDLRNQYLSLLKLSEINTQLKKPEIALTYYVQYANLKDSVLNGRMLETVNELQEKYSSLEKDKQIITLEKEATKKQIWLFTLIGSVLILLFVTFFFIYRFRIKSKLLEQNKLVGKQQKELSRLSIQKSEAENNLLKKEVETQQELNQLTAEKFKAELEHKNRELISLTMHIQNKNKVLGDIKIALQSVVKIAKSEVALSTKKIIKDIDFNMKLDTDWNQFKVHFDSVNVGFFKNLQTQFPTLSQNDLKLCAYLKINLSSKEIAQLLNISIAGINKSRNRLRKKLNLTPNENLTTFILGF